MRLDYHSLQPVVLCFISTVLVAACTGGRIEDPLADSATARTDPLSPTEGKQWPLLADGHRGGHAWSRYCVDQADNAVLPPDPRSLVQPGLNEGKAVYFNAYWKNCHVNAAPSDAAPTTCGEWRARIERGATLMKGNGAIGAGGNFSGDFSDLVPGGYATATAYNNIWRFWDSGLTERPENYDQLLAERWGMSLPAERNPYPLPGEDPNETNGGSGQLPMAFTQIREPDGTWTGKIAETCHICHSGQIGESDEAKLPGATYGVTGLSDLGTMSRDMLTAGYVLAAPLAILNRVRGTGSITNFQIFGALTLANPEYTLDYLPHWLAMQNSASTGTEDIPIWWNYGHRPLKFFDGGQPADAQRIAMSAFTPALANNPYPGNMPAAFEWIEEHDQDGVAWLLNLTSPTYPGAIDTSLATQGAILFHTKDLWAETANSSRRRPDGGNGSCASCHGAYSPYFVNNPEFLDSPELEGIAGYIVPADIIGTDLARLEANDQEVSQSWEEDWFGYPEQTGTENDCGDQNLDRIRGERENGYLAPPLYGIWASSPYFHNGSVPDVWSVLKSSDRPSIWRRNSKPNTTGLNVVMGYDTRFERAYDQAKLGWQYERIACGNTDAIPLLECDPQNEGDTPLAEQLMTQLYENLGLGWNIPSAIQIPLTNAQIERRKVYNTALYSQSNGGHTFTDVLTDRERQAIIEYLKTL